MSTVEDKLREFWDDRVGGIDQQTLSYERGYLAALQDAGVLTAEQRELWEHRFKTCPGHEGHGGLNWCAYCGDVDPRETYLEGEIPLPS